MILQLSGKSRFQLVPAVSSSLLIEASSFCPALCLWKRTKSSCGVVAPAQISISFQPIRPSLDSKASDLSDSKRSLGFVGRKKRRQDKEGETRKRKERREWREVGREGDKGMKGERKVGSLREESGREIRDSTLPSLLFLTCLSYP